MRYLWSGPLCPVVITTQQSACLKLRPLPAALKVFEDNITTIIKSIMYLGLVSTKLVPMSPAVFHRYLAAESCTLHATSPSMVTNLLPTSKNSDSACQFFLLRHRCQASLLSSNVRSQALPIYCRANPLQLHHRAMHNANGASLFGDLASDLFPTTP